MESIDISYLIQAVADVEREIMKALEKQYMETLMPLRDGIPKYLEKQVQRLTRRQSIAPYAVPSQVDMPVDVVQIDAVISSLLNNFTFLYHSWEHS